MFSHSYLIIRIISDGRQSKYRYVNFQKFIYIYIFRKFFTKTNARQPSITSVHSTAKNKRTLKTSNQNGSVTETQYFKSKKLSTCQKPIQNFEANQTKVRFKLIPVELKVVGLRQDVQSIMERACVSNYVSIGLSTRQRDKQIRRG